MSDAPKPENVPVTVRAPGGQIVTLRPEDQRTPEETAARLKRGLDFALTNPSDAVPPPGPKGKPAPKRPATAKALPRKKTR